MLADLPPTLAQIYRQVQDYQPEAANLHALQPAWKRYLARLSARLPKATVQDSGESVYLGGLSQGCQACKAGTWDCIFITMRCNLACGFCYSSHAIPAGYHGSVLGESPEQILQIYGKIPIQGISFSGGEPFLERERLFAWVRFFTSRCPDKYYWVYTNGLLANEDDLAYLAELGVAEMRFNLAATGYDHPIVLERVAQAVEVFPYVTIEIPAIPEHRAQVLGNLHTWSQLGVHYLNLHELIYEPHTNAAGMPGSRQPFVGTDGHQTAFNPQSRSLTFEVMERVAAEGLTLSVNDCSMQSKLRQLRNRRRNIFELRDNPDEILASSDRIEVGCAYQGDHSFTFHLSRLDELRSQYPGYAFVKLVRLAPLSLQEGPRWVSWEAIA